MGLFKKETCFLCGKKVGFLQKINLTDGETLCVNCRLKHCSINNKKIKELSSEEVKEHIEQLEKQQEFCKNELSKKDFFRYSNDHVKTIFADELGVFAVKNEDVEEQSIYEVFRYDQITNYFLYAPATHDEDDRLTIERVEVIIELEGHPYCEFVRIPCAVSYKGVRVYENSAEELMKKLDEIFDKPHKPIENKVLKEFSIGIGGLKFGKSPVNEIQNIKGIFTKPEGSKENENYVKNAKGKYTERADKALQGYK